MTRTIRVLCRPPTASGFGLAGLSADTAVDGAAAEPLLRALLTHAEVGVVLLEQALHDSLPPELRIQVDRVTQPVVVPFPGPAWQAAPTAEEQVVELLRRAIGYRVRLR